MGSTINGLFDAPALVPAKGYKIEISRKGFVTWQSQEFEVIAGQTVRLQVSLQLLAPAGQPEGKAPVPVFDTVRDGISTVASPEQLESQPVRDRRWSDLALLTPTVVPDMKLGGAPAFHGDAGSTLRLTDGVVASANVHPATFPQARNIPQESVDSFQTVSTAWSAELSRAMGGWVNTVTRSGGTAYHGAVYDYFSNHSLSAIDRYALGNKLFQRQNQAGASFGGPRKEGSNLFFFGNIEYLDGRHKGLNRITNPLIADSTGTSVAASNCKATAAQCTAATKFIQDQMNVLVPRSEHSLAGLLRLDYRPSDRNNLIFAANAAHGRSPEGPQNQDVAPNGGLLGNGEVKRDTKYAKLSWIANNGGSLVNEMRLGIFHDRYTEGAGVSNLSTKSLGITVAGVTVGATNPMSSVFNEHRTQFVENLRFSFHSHTVTLGFDLLRATDRIDKLDDAFGTYNYASLTAFATDFSGGTTKSYMNFTQQFGRPNRLFRPSQLGLYAQDNFALSPRLHVLFGVRWEKPGVPQPMQENSNYYQTGTISSPNNNADPHLGFVYQWKENTVLRAGFGIYHGTLRSDILDQLEIGNAVSTSSISINATQTNSPVFGSVYASKAKVPSGATMVMFANGKLRTPYTQQTVLELERQLAHKTAVTFTYLGVRGTKLWTAGDINIATPSKRADYYVLTSAGQVQEKFSTILWTVKDSSKYSRVFQVGNGGGSWYHAGVAQLRKTMAHGVAVKGSYTWSHSIDDQGQNRIAGNIPWSTYNADHMSDRGSSATDQRHRVVIDWMWQPTVAATAPAPLRAVVNGWEVSGLAFLGSAAPHTATALVYGQQFQGLTMPYTSSMNGTGSWNRALTIPVSSLRGQAERTVNARLSRSFSITEGVKAKLLFEAFNLTNTQFDTGVNTIAYTATSGRLTPVTGYGLGNVAAGYNNGSNARSAQVAFRLAF